MSKREAGNLTLQLNTTILSSRSTLVNTTTYSLKETISDLNKSTSLITLYGNRE